MPGRATTASKRRRALDQPTTPGLPPGPLVTLPEIAAWRDVTYQSAYVWFVRGLLPPALRVGPRGRLSWRRADLIEWEARMWGATLTRRAAGGER